MQDVVYPIRSIKGVPFLADEKEPEEDCFRAAFLKGSPTDVSKPGDALFWRPVLCTTGYPAAPLASNREVSVVIPQL